MVEPFIITFRAYSGSQVVYFDSGEPEPVGITNKVEVSRRFNLSSVSGTVGSRILWKWNGQDTSQFDLVPVQNQGFSGSLQVISSSFSPTSKSLFLSSSAAATGFGDHIVFLATSSLPTTNYIVEIGIRDVANDLGDSQGGPVVLAFGSGSSFHGLGVLQRENSTQLSLPLWTAGVLDDTNNNNAGNPADPTFMAIEVRGNRAFGSIYSFEAISIGRGRFGEGARVIKSSDWSPLALSWATSSIGRFGLALRTNAGVTAPRLIVDHFLIRSHPYLA